MRSWYVSVGVCAMRFCTYFLLASNACKVLQVVESDRFKVGFLGYGAAALAIATATC